MTMRAVAGATGGGGGADYVLKAGDTMTGALTVPTGLAGTGLNFGSSSNSIYNTANATYFATGGSGRFSIMSTGPVVPSSFSLSFGSSGSNSVDASITRSGANALSIVATNGVSFNGPVTLTGISTAISAKTAAYTATLADHTILANGTFTVTVNPALRTGAELVIKNTGTGTITIAPSTGTIDGVANKTIATQYVSVTIKSDGTNWWVI